MAVSSRLSGCRLIAGSPRAIPCPGLHTAPRCRHCRPAGRTAAASAPSHCRQCGATARHRRERACRLPTARAAAACRTGRGAQHQRATEQALAGRDPAQRPDRAGVVAGQQHGLRAGSALHKRFQQALREAAQAGAHRGGRGHRPGTDGPIASRGVMHRVMELGRRDRQRVAGQRGAHVVGDRQVAVRGGKDRRQAGRVAAGGGAGRQRGFQRHRNGVRRTAAFVGRQQLRRRAGGGFLQRAAAHECAGGFPVG